MLPLTQNSPPTREFDVQRHMLDDVFSLVYEELRRLAAFVRRNEVNVTLNSTALVHEAWLKLKDAPRLADTALPHFKAIAGKAMRQVLVDQARHRSARKRGGAGEAALVSLGDSDEAAVSTDSDLLLLNVALDRLAQLNERQAQVIEGRFFGGLSVTETAALLGVSESVVERDWRAAKAWLGGQIRSARS